MIEPTTELVNRIVAEWLRACGERDWFAVELRREQSMHKATLDEMSALRGTLCDAEKRATELEFHLNHARGELGVAREERDARTKELRGIHDALVGTETAPSPIEEVAARALGYARDLRKRHDSMQAELFRQRAEEETLFESLEKILDECPSRPGHGHDWANDPEGRRCRLCRRSESRAQPCYGGRHDWAYVHGGEWCRRCGAFVSEAYSEARLYGRR